MAVIIVINIKILLLQNKYRKMVIVFSINTIIKIDDIMGTIRAAIPYSSPIVVPEVDGRRER